MNTIITENINFYNLTTVICKETVATLRVLPGLVCIVLIFS